jgi:hypothetical protein
MWQYQQTTELYHHGILGMHWHHHKSSTSEEFISGNRSPNEPLPTRKSNRRLKLEEHYKSQGFSEKDAIDAANKRIRAEKTLAVLAGVTVAAASAYVISKHYKDTVDKTINMGASLQNMSTRSNRGVEDAFYASLNNRDNTKYRGLYGNQLGGLTDKHVYETKIKALSSIKVASKKNAADAFNQMLKDDKESAKAISEHLNNLELVTPGQQKTLAKARLALQNGKIDKNVYEAFNLSLTDHSSEKADTAAKKFYDVLKKKGYGAIQDINDMKYSGYNTKSPVIVFDGPKSLVVDKVREVGAAEIQKDMAKGYADIMGTNLLKTGAKVTAVYGGAKIIQKSVDDIQR